MFNANGTGDVGSVNIYTSQEGGHSAKDIADMALNHNMQVSETAPPVIRDQAMDHKDRLRKILIYYMNNMAKSERTTIWALMKKQGHEEIAEIIRRL